MDNRDPQRLQPSLSTGLTAGQDYRYGKTTLSIYRKSGGLEEV